MHSVYLLLTIGTIFISYVALLFFIPHGNINMFKLWFNLMSSKLKPKSLMRFRAKLVSLRRDKERDI